jgi:hypothetical protein
MLKTMFAILKTVKMPKSINNTNHINFFYLDLKRFFRSLKRHSVDKMNWQSSVPHYFRKWNQLRGFFDTNSPVIETGTYLGETTKFFSNICKCVVSFEPEQNLAKYNNQRFRKNPNITIVSKSSEDGLHAELIMFAGLVNFWLDGHFSGENTFGNTDEASPIVHELQTIFAWVNTDNLARIAIDDARLFTGSDGYPTLSKIIDISFKHKYNVRVESDIIFIFSE